MGVFFLLFLYKLSFKTPYYGIYSRDFAMIFTIKKKYKKF